MRGLHILHDNAPAHRSAVVTEYLEEQYIKTLPHPAYSPGPEVIKILFSIQLSMKFFLLIKVKMPAIFLLINVKMQTTVSNNCWHFNIYEQKNSIFGLSEAEIKLNI